MARGTSRVSISASQNIHEMCPAERLPFTLSHPLLIPQSTSDGQVSLLKGKQRRRKKRTGCFSALRLFTFCTYTEPQSDLPQGSLCYHQLGTLPKPPPTHHHSSALLLEVRHANCSPCLLDGTQRGGITQRQTNAALHKISSHVHRRHPLKHSSTLCLHTGWKQSHALIHPVFPITLPLTPTLRPQLHCKCCRQIIHL